jgi:hypothetical protein
MKRKPYDVWFSFFIRFRDNWTCQICGSADIGRRDNKPWILKKGASIIECMHIIERGNKSTRCNEKNAIAGCKKCHEYYSFNKEKWYKWCKKNIKHYDMLRYKSKKVSFEYKYKGLTDKLKQEYMFKTLDYAVPSRRLWILGNNLSKKNLAEYNKEKKGKK